MDWTALLQAVQDKAVLFFNLAYDTFSDPLIILLAASGISVFGWFAVEWLMPSAAWNEAKKKQAALITGLILCFLSHAGDIYPFGDGPPGWGRCGAAAIFGAIGAAILHWLLKKWFPFLTKGRATSGGE